MAGTADVDALVERDSELDRLRALVDAAAGGHGGALVLEGPAGIGKTSLVAAGCELAAERGLVRLTACGGELERDFAYGVVRQLFEAHVAGVGAAQQAALLQGSAGLAAPLLGLPADAHAARYRGILGDDPTSAALHGLYWLAANLASEQPLLIAVDDLHWCDTASVRFLAYLARRVAELPLVLVAASRPPVEAHAPQLIEALAADPAVRRLEPAPLSATAVAAVVRGALGGAAQDAFCAACHETTGGNPFLVRAVVNALGDAGVAPTAANSRRLPDVGSRAVARSVGQRLARLGPAAVALARAVAVLGTNADVRRATVLAGLDEAGGAAAADALVAAQVFAPGRQLEFVHPLVRSAVRGAIAPAQLARSHVVAARLLHDDGVDAERIAPHLLAASPRGDGWAVAVLRAAAARSIDRGAPEAAVRYLRRALDEPPELELRPELLAELGKAEVRAALPDEAVEHLRKALEATADPRRRAQMTHDLALGLIAPGRYVEAVRMLEEAIESVHTADPELARRIDAELICAARLVADTLPVSREHIARLQPALAGRTPGERMLLATLAQQHTIDGAPAADAVELAGRAVRGGLVAEQSGDSGLVIDAVFALIVGGELELAEHTIEQALADVRRRGSVIGFARQTCMRALLNLERGALADAESDARSTIDAAWEPGYRIARMAYGPLVGALVDQGRLDEADDALTAAGLQGEIADSFMLNFVRFSRARLRGAQGRHADAAADLQALAGDERKWRADNPATFAWRSQLALARQHQGDVAGAIALVEEELEHARRVGTMSAIGRALRALGLLRGGDAGLLLLQDSLAALAGSAWRLEHARTLVELGAAIRRAGRRTDSREPLHAGMELAHTCGATGLAERARAELVAAGARPRRIMRTGVDALTASERRVAGMAVGGMTNREIAQALFVTIRTVEVHLTHAYQKLDIRSRGQLAQALRS